MKLKFKKVKLTNFFSFENAEIILDRPGYTLVSGINQNQIDCAVSNGSGKSALWESIVWALTGETIREAKEVSRLGVKDTCSVELTFVVDDTEYVVIRTKNPSNLKLIVNGEDKSGKGIRDTKGILLEYLPDLTKSLIGSVIILGQGLPQKFSENLPSKRKEILETLAKTDFIIDDLKDRISKRKQEILNDIRKIEDATLVSTTKIKSLEGLINDSEFKLGQLKDPSALESLIHAAEQEAEELGKKRLLAETEKTNFESDLLKYTEQLNKLYTTKQSEIEAVSESHRIKIDSIREEINTIKARKTSLELEIHRINSIKDICPTCGQKLPNVEKPDASKQLAELNSVTVELKSLAESLSQNVSLKENALKEIEQKFSIEINNNSNQTSILKKEISDLNIRIQEFSTKNVGINSLITRYKTELASLETTRKNYLENLKKYKQEIQELNEYIKEQTSLNDNLVLHKDTVVKIETAIKRDLRGKLLNDVINYIDKKAKEYSLEVFGTDKVSFVLDGNNISITYDEKEYENLSGGERQRVDIIVQFALRSMLCNTVGFTSNIICLDELFDNLDSIGCENILNLVSKLDDVETIYIITHHASIDIPYDNTINIVKGPDKISRVYS